MKRTRSPFARIRVEELERRDTPTFTPAGPFTNGFGNPDIFAVADFNGDGNADLAVGVNANGQGVNGAVQILLGDGTGAFTTGQTVPLPIPGADPSSITTFRSAATNHVSLAVATFTAGSLPTPGGTVVFDGNGTGTFATPGVILDGTPVMGIATGDFNGDGVDDLVTATVANGYQIFTQNAAGGFALTDANAGSIAFPRLAVGDFDNDGHQDFAALSNANGSQVIIFYGAGNGTVAQVVTTTVSFSTGVQDLVAGDFNHDGIDDLVVAQGSNVLFHQASANRTIDAAGVDIPALAAAAGATVEQLAVCDFDGDGEVDDVVAQDGVGDARVAYAAANGTFVADAGNPYSPTSSFGQAGSVAGGDFNNDGAFDFVLTNFGDTSNLTSGQVFFNVVPTTTTVVNAPNPSVLGNPVTFTATVQPTVGTGIPTGTVTFTIDGNPQTPIAMTNGQASFTINSLDVGDHTVFADYSGATTFARSTSPAVTQTVHPADSTTTLVANPNPATYGDTVVLTATVGSLAGPGTTATPTGTVTFTIYGKTFGPVGLTGNTASVNVPGLPAGTYPATATYSGDVHFNPSTNNTTEIVNQAPTTTTQTVPQAPVPPGQALVVNVLVTGAGQNPGPSGQVELVDQNSGAVLGSATLNPANGTATITVNNPPTGPRTVFTRYLGDTNFLISSSTPAAISVQAFTVLLAGSDHGEAVCLFSNDPNQRGGVDQFGPGFTGIRPAAGDFNLDGFTDVLAGSAPGDASRVALMDGKTRQFVSAFSPFGDNFTGGVFVAAGDINGDGRPDIAVSADVGGGTRVRVFLTTAAGFVPVADFMGIDDANFRGGCRVAIGDVNRDGFADVVVGAGPGGGARIAGYDGKALSGGTVQHLFNDFFAFDPTSRVGAFVAAGDVNGDGFAEIVVGADTGGGPRVTVFDGASLMGGQLKVMANFFAGPEDVRGGIRVAVRDFNSDGFADVITGPGGTDGSKQKVFDGASLANGDATLLLQRDPFPGLFFGIYVA